MPRKRKSTMQKIKEQQARMLAQAKRNGTPCVVKGVNVTILNKPKTAVQDVNFLKAMYIDWMSDPKHMADTRSQALFCQLFKCAPALVKVWTKEKETQQEIRKNVRELFGGGERIKKLYDRLWEQADKGIISAIRLALELVGEYTPKLQHLDKPKSLEDMLEQMEKADKNEKAGVFPGLRLSSNESDKPSVH